MQVAGKIALLKKARIFYSYFLGGLLILSAGVAKSALETAPESPQESPKTNATSSPEDSLVALQTEKQSLRKTDESRRAVLSDLYKINFRIARMTRERSQFELLRNRTHRKVKDLSQLVAQLEKKIEHQRIKVIGRLKTLYKFGDQGVLRLAFSSEKSTDFDLGVRFLKILLNSDYLLLKDYQRNVRDLRIQKDKLSGHAQKLTGLEFKVKQKETQLLAQQQDKGQLLSKIDTNQVLRLARLKVLRLQAKSETGSEAQISKLQALEKMLMPTFVEKKGHLGLPVSGVISSGFGDFKDQELPQIILRQKGVTLRSADDADVKSVYSGKIVHAGVLVGFGKTLVVDHGDHYYSVYSHLESTKVTVGTEVSEGTLLGKSGALYFEIRHFSEAVDPAAWLVK